MKNKIKIILVAGARPNFMKVAPLMHEMKKHDEFKPILVHTGQHYDENMSEKFFKQLGICNPDINLDVGSASHAVQTARIMERFEKVCLNERPDAVLVVGDVNSTAACVLVASKLNIKTIHYEAGLRSRDKSMPEEINRMVTDAICDIFFTTSKDADENLINEGHDKEQIFMYGNLMIDSLVKNLKKAKSVNMEFRTLSGKKIKYGKDFKKKNYGVMTFHRPSNVDDPDKLLKLVNIWGRISEK
ncbi:MAG: UDP-N-acetylglucosamine 2-epimerase, partial [Desulfurellaceae bacterium]|nr:UDP-N-acetylglucosamine 2-epimerase [Desulfurellaceae bacterium]